MVAGDEPDTSYFEIRGLDKGAIVARQFTPVRELDTAMRKVARLARTCDVYLGCAPRTSNQSGTLKDIARVWCLWADCDSEDASARLRQFRPRPSIVVQSSPDGITGIGRFPAVDSPRR